MSRYRPYNEPGTTSLRSSTWDDKSLCINEYESYSQDNRRNIQNDDGCNWRPYPLGNISSLVRYIGRVGSRHSSELIWSEMKLSQSEGFSMVATSTEKNRIIYTPRMSHLGHWSSLYIFDSSHKSRTSPNCSLRKTCRSDHTQLPSRTSVGPRISNLVQKSWTTHVLKSPPVSETDYVLYLLQ